METSGRNETISGLIEQEVIPEFKFRSSISCLLHPISKLFENMFVPKFSDGSRRVKRKSLRRVMVGIRSVMYFTYTNAKRSLSVRGGRGFRS